MAKIDKLLKHAKEHFDDGENALQSVLGAYETEIMGTETVRNGIFVATDQRLLFFSKKLTGFDLEVFPYPNISSMEMGKNFMGHHIKFFASGNSIKVKWITQGDVSAFVDTVKAQMTAEKSNKSITSQQSTDFAKQLEQLKQLHAAEVLTDEEFLAKKALILERL